VEALERHRQEDIRTMIQRHLLMHVYNPSQFFRGRKPMIPSSPYIPYAQFPSGMPGQRKRKFRKSPIHFYKATIFYSFLSAGPEGEQGLPVCKHISSNFLSHIFFILRVHKVSWVKMVCLVTEVFQ
jgi:hypothetical protein